MKYHTLRTSSLSGETKESTLTIYTGPDFIQEKMDRTETAIVLCELEMAQCALKLQTRRCRQLVSEFTRKLEAKELEVISEQRLRDEQLNKVFRSLLEFEARLKQEQTFIRHQLQEKDDIIQRQRRELRRLRNTVLYCNECTQFYTGSNINCCDSSYVENQENWESGSELYGSLPENHSSSGEESHKHEYENTKITYEKKNNNKTSDGSYKRSKKSNIHRRMTGIYLQVLKSRESSADSSLEDAYSKISDAHTTREQIKQVSDRIGDMFGEGASIDDTYSSRMNCLHGIKESTVTDVHKGHIVSSLSENSECNTPIVCNVKPNCAIFNDQSNSPLFNQLGENSTKKVPKSDLTLVNPVHCDLTNNETEITHSENTVNKGRLISDTITVFDVDDSGQNENWYASASDPEDDGQQDLYRNNPVLECMNQILLQNINDTTNSPPKSPELDRNSKSKFQKRVKFSDENQDMSSIDLSIQNKESSENSFKKKNNDAPLYQGDYYETPIQVGPNFYEVPQSIYSNDYELIINRCESDSIYSCAGLLKAASPTSKIENLQENQINRMATQKLTLTKCNHLNKLETENQQHYYIDMDTGASNSTKQAILKRTKLAHTPPALPPKPANLISKFRMQSSFLNKSLDDLANLSVDSEPDYCSISELNLPTEKMIISHSLSTIPKPSIFNKSEASFHDGIALDNTLSNLVTKNDIQAPKHPQINNEKLIANIVSIEHVAMINNKIEPEIPKLPQVSEIIIPEENEENKEAEHISQDNYIKNNSQLLKQITAGVTNDKLRNRIVIGTSVSNLVSSCNNQHTILSKAGVCKLKIDQYKINDSTSFKYSQNYEKQFTIPEKPKCENLSFEKFDLSQNFEEFNLDDCEIGEDYQSDASNYETNYATECISNENNLLETENLNTLEVKSNTSVEIVRATKDMHPHRIKSLQQLQKSLSSQRNSLAYENEATTLAMNSRDSEPTYEHFLECTGLSSKSILTPSQMLSNHKTMLKPKTIKLRSRVKSTGVFEHPSGTVKYWSEPYL